MTEEQWRAHTKEDAIERMLHRKDKSIITLGLILINCVIFVILEIAGGSQDSDVLLRFGASCTSYVSRGEWYRLFTCMFLHAGLPHLLNNMLLLLVIGDYVERYMGRIRFLVIYVLGGLAANWFSWYMAVRTEREVLSVGASGAVFAIIGAMAVLVILHKGRLEDLTLKRVGIMVVLSLLAGFQAAGVDGTAHLGGFVFGSLLAMLLSIPICKRRR